MSQAMQYEFRLFGPYKGLTKVINGHKFVHGVYRTVVAPHSAATLMQVLSFYGAYAKGTKDYDEALAAEAAKEAAENGADEVHTEAERREHDPVSDGLQPDGGGLAPPATDERGGADSDPAQGEGVDPAGGGHEHAGVPKFEEAAEHSQPGEPSSEGSVEVQQAMLKLDPENDAHWVKAGPRTGLPKLAAVEEAYGKAGLTAADLEAAIPGWNREKAVARMLEN